eukprot:TRINITY_DN46099_c0_g1_i1.p1 TRINITY_DN46099_c0_g1~~TRINITY_DN46099_c0_g1_i1.p1  ORF type:complete len:339 (+),score=80.45 TRINITY_DN46099_c0_g1_i1:177-1193(+)
MAMEEDPHAESRAKFLAESLEISNEPRWGYFGIPGSLAIGDNSYAPRLVRKPKDEEEGDPIRNIQAAPLKKGSSTDVYFTFELPLALGDPYQDPGAINKKGKIWMLDPDAKFKPPGKVTVPINKGLEYVNHCDSVKDPRAVREAHAEVGPRNMLCNPPKKGGGGVYTPGVLFGMDENRYFPEVIGDDYDAARKMRLKDLEEHKKLLQEAPFKQMDYGNKPFFNNTDTYMYDVPTHVPRDKKVENNNAYPHETPFRPANPMKRGIAPVAGMSALIGGVPEYVPDPLPGGAVRKPAEEGEERPAFKLGSSRIAPKPTPSVTTNRRNMRNERPSSFMRPSL